MLRVLGTYKTEAEKQGMDYEKKYGVKTASWFHAWAPNSSSTYSGTDILYNNKYNNWGNREINSDSFASSPKTKIVCIGDSFTEGDGAPYDSTWVKSFEKRIGVKHANIKTYNAGVCGSDPFFDYKMLKLTLLKLRPKMVISVVNYSDVYDVIIRGGDERFNPDSTTSYKNGPFWLPAYQYSHVFRLIMVQLLKYNSHLLINESNQAVEEDKAVALLKKKAEETKQLCDANGIAFYIVIHPHPLEITNKNNKLSLAFADFPFAINLFNTLYPFYNTHDIKEYSWAKNHHFNSKGYWLMGDAIATQLLNQQSFCNALSIQF